MCAVGSAQGACFNDFVTKPACARSWIVDSGTCRGISVGGGVDGFGQRCTGGVGGLGAPGATIIGSYTNSTESDVTLDITVGSDGTAGAPGNFGLDGLDGVFPFAPATDGEPGGDGGFGNAGDSSVIAIFTSPIDEPALLVLAGGGEGGTGGDGGGGGTAGDGNNPGVDGVNGIAGVDGEFDGESSSQPNPLPEGWSFGAVGSPGVVFTGDEPEPTTSTSTTLAPTTTVTPTTVTPSTVTPSSAVPVVTHPVSAASAGGQLPATGASTSLPLVMAMVAFALGAVMLLASRRRSANQQ